jgi:hypothetical protein
MAGLNLIYVQDIIAAYVREQFPGYEVYEDDVLDNEALLKQSNKIKPYIVLQWAGLFASGSTSFVGVRYDEYDSAVDINVVAPTPRQAREAMNIIMDKLIGWKPTGGGAMNPEGGSGLFVVPDYNGSPHVYIASTRLSFAVNSEDPGSYITP